MQTSIEIDIYQVYANAYHEFDRGPTNEHELPMKAEIFDRVDRLDYRVCHDLEQVFRGLETE